MMGARAVSLAVAARDVHAALADVPQAERVAVLIGVLAGEARESGDVPLFFALVQEAVRERLGHG